MQRSPSFLPADSRGMHCNICTFLVAVARCCTRPFQEEEEQTPIQLISSFLLTCFFFLSLSSSLSSALLYTSTKKEFRAASLYQLPHSCTESRTRTGTAPGAILSLGTARSMAPLCCSSVTDYRKPVKRRRLRAKSRVMFSPSFFCLSVSLSLSGSQPLRNPHQIPPLVPKAAVHLNRLSKPSAHYSLFLYGYLLSTAVSQQNAL